MATIARPLASIAAALALASCSDSTPAWWGEPIEAKANEWTWIDFPGTECADGSPTGLAVNLSPSENPSGVLIYLEAGGACWDYASCNFNWGDIGLALHLDGYDQADFEGLWGGAYRAMVPFDRENDANPFKDAHYVFVPYCTADVFGGDRIAELFSDDQSKVMTLHFRGHHNMEEYLARLVPTFHDVPRVWLAGSSAGGFGAQLNWFTVAERFGDVRVDVISDSGQPINPPAATWQEWLSAWDLVMPAGCADCNLGVDRILRYGAETLLADGARYGLIVYEHDPVISTFFGLSVDEHAAAVDELLMTLDDPSMPNHEQAHYYALDGYFHTTWLTGFTSSEVDGVMLSDWMAQMVNDDPAWSSVGPN